MNKQTFSIIILLFSGLSLAQPLTLFECYNRAKENHPLQQEIKNRRLNYEMNRKNLNAKWLPQLKGNAQAIYMSNVVEFDNILGALPIPIAPGAFQSMPKEQYKATLDITQTIYDGGAVKAAKLVEHAKLQAEEKAVQVEFYKIQNQINSSYFGLLKLEKQNAVLDLFQEQILAKHKSLKSAVDNGMLLPQNLYALDAELLQLEQRIDEIGIHRKSLLSILEQLVGDPIKTASTLSLPHITIADSATMARPELALFSTQKEALEANKKAIGSQRLPKAMLFGTYGYGNPPGNDFFTDEFDDYFMVGAGLSWTIFDWRTTKRNKLTIRAQQKIIDAKRIDFERMIQIALLNAGAEIERAQSLLAKDKELVELRQRITLAVASQVENGVISATEYLVELNAEKEARINLEIHKIQVVEAHVNFMTISGQIQNNY
jgi:outer membrane protein TolC